jgi:hypothetical protein
VGNVVGGNEERIIIRRRERVFAQNTRALTGLRKNSGFDFAFKGRGFSRAVSLAKSMAALAADAPPSYQDDFFRSLLMRACRNVSTRIQ